jgi:tRNA modification GTPase
VTPIAGTTRDRIKQSISLDGVPIHIVDTAGLRHTTDEVESKGIERSWASIRAADLVLFLDAPEADSSQDPGSKSDLYAEVAAALPPGCRALRVLNKADLIASTDSVAAQADILVSAKTGFGIAELKSALLAASGWHAGQEGLVISRQRHIDCLMRAEESLNRANAYAQEGNRALELFAEELRLAQEHLGQITGRLLPDDLLGKIFSQFCIGK